MILIVTCSWPSSYCCFCSVCFNCSTHTSSPGNLSTSCRCISWSFPFRSCYHLSLHAEGANQTTSVRLFVTFITTVWFDQELRTIRLQCLIICPSLTNNFVFVKYFLPLEMGQNYVGYWLFSSYPFSYFFSSYEPTYLSTKFPTTQ